MFTDEEVLSTDGIPLLIRQAVSDDIWAIEQLIEPSIRVLGGRFYNEAEIESSLRFVFGADTTMIEDGTYMVIAAQQRIIGAGGWSHRWTPFGGDQATPVRDADFRVPGKDPAIIRAMYVHPDWARRGIGTTIIETCESAAQNAGFLDLELVATLSGVAFYERMGYQKTESIHYVMDDGTTIEFVRMSKPA